MKPESATVFLQIRTISWAASGLLETLDRPHAYASVSNNPFRSKILHAFIEKRSRIQVNAPILYTFPGCVKNIVNSLHVFGTCKEAARGLTRSVRPAPESGFRRFAVVSDRFSFAKNRHGDHGGKRKPARPLHVSPNVAGIFLSKRTGHIGCAGSHKGKHPILYTFSVRVKNNGFSLHVLKKCKGWGGKRVHPGPSFTMASPLTLGGQP